MGNFTRPLSWYGPCLTLGRQGLWYVQTETKESIALGAHEVTAVDETAAGDAFVVI